MGAVTVTLDSMEPGVAGALRVATGSLVMSDSYATGGDVLDPLQFGFYTLVHLNVAPPYIAGTPSNGFLLTSIVEPTNTTTPAGTTNTGRVVALSVPYAQPAASAALIGTSNQAQMVEVDSGTDLSGYTARFVAFGY